MPLRVCIPRPHGDFRARLRERLPPGVELVDAPAECDVLVEGVPNELPGGVRAVVVPYAGVPRRTRDLLRGRTGVTLHNLHHNAAPTAEVAMALFLAAAKAVVPLDRALRRGDWRPRWEERGDLLCAGRTAVVAGHGAIGRRVAAACRGLGMEVAATRRSGDGTGGVLAPGALPGLLPRAHALFVCLPWTEETEGLLDADALARLPDGAVVVNVARGPIVDEDALWDECRAGRLRAGLDVWWRYPEDEQARAATPPSAHPFGDLDHVVLSPHRAGSSERIEELRAAALAELLAAAARGAPLPNRVDPERGY